MKYVEIAKGNVRNRGVVIPLPDLARHVQHAQGNEDELFRSIYEFDEEVLEHFKVRKTIRNYKGTYYLSRLVFDIDKGEDTDTRTLERARALVMELMEDWSLLEEHIRPWFSGRGYHILTPDIFGFQPSNELPAVVKETLSKHFPDLDTSIYMHSGIIRVGRTFNSRSRLYKVPLSLAELMNCKSDEILSKAENYDKPSPSAIEDPSEPPDHSDKIVVPKPEEVRLSPNSSGIVTCMQHLYSRGEQQGRRHTDILRLASAYRRAGLPYEAVLDLMKVWASTLEAYEVKRIVDDVFKKQYQFSCKDKVMEEFCDSRCIFYKNKGYGLESMSQENAEKCYAKFLRTDFEDRSFDLNDVYDIGSPFWFYPGELITLIGDSGLGKTAFVQEMCIKLNRMRILYLSLEVDQRLLFRRFCQIAWGYTKTQVMKHFKENKGPLFKPFEHIQISTHPPTLQALARLIAESRPHIVVIDTLDGIKYDGFTRDRIEPIILGLDDMAKQQDTIILAVHHLAKAYAIDDKGNPKPLTMHSGKGASAAYQKPDKVIGIEGHMSERTRTLKSLKSRDETPFDIQLTFNYETFTFTHSSKIAVKQRSSPLRII